MKRIQDDSRRTAIRQAGTGDCDAIRAFLAGLSPQTRYLRFFTGAPGANTAAVRRLAGDGENIDAVVATEAGAIIGHAIAADLTDASGARITEIGVTVTDARQGQGVGSALTRELAARAKARGATAMAMDVLAENRRALSMIAGHWPAARYDRSGPYVTIHTVLPEQEDDRRR
ncbi:MAG TPA: GNAT family N-acetyltransferase [Streptosporangiaceae bacterium]|nr:GNAT family N-acetyltransferase [Streptosporangiaceae bacterium]